MLKVKRIPFENQKTLADNTDFLVAAEDVIDNDGTTDSYTVESRGYPIWMSSAGPVNFWEDRAYWEFDTEILNIGNRGLVVSNVNIRNNSRSLGAWGGTHTSESIFEEISFHGIKMNFRDKDTGRSHEREFDFNRKDSERKCVISAVGQAEAYFKHFGKKKVKSYHDRGDNEYFMIGTFSMEKDHLVQRAIRFTAYNYIQGKTKVNGELKDDLIEVRCDIDISFCREGADFDQVEAFHGLKIYPELALTYRSIPKEDIEGGEFHGSNTWNVIHEFNDVIHLDDNHSLRIVQFDAAIKLIENPTNQHMSMGNNNYASFFADSNGPRSWNRYTETWADGLEKYLTTPGWSFIFDYMEPNITHESKVYAVGADPSFRSFGTEPYKSTQKERVGWYAWPKSTSANEYSVKKRKLKKRKRQGAFDNLHVHGEMMPTVFGDPAIHAPVCGRACIHMHWRWGDAASFVDTPPLPSASEFNLLAPANNAPSYGDRTNKFCGWNKTSNGKWVSNDTAWESLGLPLIPPNQSLKIAVVNPSKSLAAVNSMTINNSNSTQLSQTKKAVWYISRIFSPKKEQKQVICSHGIGYALEYHNKPGLLYPMVANMHGLGLSGLDYEDQLALIPNSVLSAAAKDTKLNAWRDLRDDVIYWDQMTANQVPLGPNYPGMQSMDESDLHALFLHFYDFIRYFYNSPFTGRHQSPNGSHNKGWASYNDAANTWTTLSKNMMNL